ncbi:orotate phosphoribosyltransferase [Dinghuibacter silviterrae]|uniref:Orotate phosphoribosyltransferase n=1 Tax=Dinghuibacter silviterrae TaxID=1539049 RepID=A0A4R8DIA1_9BACT|nr:orotate phosphoribosyltransferase [Dinghuibacter silviterrae]TDW97024.1 orotate phosphoribosyltransferase [Dinghuibacter silviterrae]
MTNQKAVAERLLQINAIRLNPESPFTWTSGWKSPIYCDNRKALGFPPVREFIKSEFCNLIFTELEDAGVLAGVATAGIAWGAMAADQLKLPYVYVRSKPKEHGLGNQIEGHFEPGQKTVVVEDLFSTGKSSLEAVAVLRQAGAEVIGAVGIFDYGFDTARDAFAAAGVPYYALSNYATLIELAVERGLVNPSQQALLMEWRQNPALWGK